jgi:hypothetical protein
LSDPNNELLDNSGATEAAQEEEEFSEDQDQEEFSEDEPYTNSEEEIVEDSKQKQQHQQFQEQPGEQLSRQQKRNAERQQSKPLPRPNNNNNSKDRRNRLPQESPVDSNIERYSEVENPSSQLLDPGVEPSRAQQLFAAGELQGIGRKALIRAASRMQAYRTAFIEWQAQRDDYIIFQNVGTDSKTGKDQWEPVTYRLHFLTMGQEERMRDMTATLSDLQRAQQNNDTSVSAVNTKIRKVQKAILRFKLRTYFRMYISDKDPEDGTIDPDDELQRASSVDVRDMIDSAEWAFQWVPKSRRIKPSELSGSKAESEYGMIQ